MANKEKMTKREFLTAVLAMEGVTADVAEFAQAEVAKLDAVNEKRRNTPSKKDVENAPIMETLAGMLTTEPVTASDVAPAAEISVQKASALLRKLVDEGKAVQVEVKIKGKGAQKGYTLPVAE